MIRVLKCFPSLKTKGILATGALVLAGAAITMYATSQETGMQMLIGSCIMCFTVFLVVTVWKKVLDNCHSRVVAISKLYENKCDPEAFLQEVQPLVDVLKEPYNTEEIWLLTYYANALSDVGRTDEAQSWYMRLKTRVESMPKDVERAMALLYLEPLTCQMEGNAVALRFLQEAADLFGAVDDPSRDSFFTPMRSYGEWESTVLGAIEYGQPLSAIQPLQKTRGNANCSTLLRVRCAYLLSLIFRNHLWTQEEVNELAFIVSNGNKLPHVPYAMNRLQEIADELAARAAEESAARAAALEQGEVPAGDFGALPAQPFDPATVKYDPNAEVREYTIEPQVDPASADAAEGEYACESVDAAERANAEVAQTVATYAVDQGEGMASAAQDAAPTEPNAEPAQAALGTTTTATASETPHANAIPDVYAEQVPLEGKAPLTSHERRQ